MVSKLRFTSNFIHDFDEIVEYYKAQNYNLGNEFSNFVNDKLGQIASKPDVFSVCKYKPDYRTVTLGKYPYSVYFRMHNNSIVISAISHHARGEEFIKGSLH